ncbi:hypothetical protein JYT28_00560 [Desulfobulbus sp. AH-315-M07]|nr:hypothetical protein [Desulfobulbus sp. AH-315-M07]
MQFLMQSWKAVHSGSEKQASHSAEHGPWKAQLAQSWQLPPPSHIPGPGPSPELLDATIAVETIPPWPDVFAVTLPVCPPLPTEPSPLLPPAPAEPIGPVFDSPSYASSAARPPHDATAIRPKTNKKALIGLLYAR